MTMRHRAAFVLVPLLLAGCAGGGQVLTLSAEETLLVTCPEGQSIAVEELDTVRRPACSPLGSELVFPDGTLLAMDTWAVAGSTTSGDSALSYAFTNVGVYGVVASAYTADCADIQVWGRAEAIEKVREAFGDGLGNC